MRLPVLFLTLLFLQGMSLMTDAPATAAEVKAKSAIDAVVVFPSGAEVTRLAKVKLEAGEHTILLVDLPAGAIPGSIRVEGKATGKLEIGSVDTRRLSVPRTDPQALATERRRIEGEIEKLRDQRNAIQAEAQTAELQKQLLARLATLPDRGPPANAQGVVQQPDWNQLFGLIGSRMTEVNKAILDAGLRTRDLDRTIKDLERKLAEVAPAMEDRTEVKVNVVAGGALDADLTIRYQVGNAGWQPLYDARLVTGAKNVAPKLTLVRRAMITQRTGEDWTEVAMSLSTTRPGAGTAAPELYPLTVDIMPDQPPVAYGRAEDSDRSVRSRAMDAMPAPAAAPAPMAPAPKIAAEAVAVEQRRATIEAAAFQVVFGVPGRLTVQTNGEQKRVQIMQEQIEPSLTARTVPRVDPKAYLYAKMTMPKGAPILAGQVALFRDNTFVGNGRFPQLAAGEEHELGFGADDSIRVRHVVVEEKRAESGIITTTKSDTRNFRIIMRSLHERSMPILVLDQMPVSQNQDIKVDFNARTAPTKRDYNERRGVLAWEMRLEPEVETTIEFGYRLAWPAAKQIRFGRGAP